MCVCEGGSTGSYGGGKQTQMSLAFDVAHPMATPALQQPHLLTVGSYSRLVVSRTGETSGAEVRAGED